MRWQNTKIQKRQTKPALWCIGMFVTCFVRTACSVNPHRSGNLFSKTILWYIKKVEYHRDAKESNSYRHLSHVVIIITSITIIIVRIIMTILRTIMENIKFTSSRRAWILHNHKWKDQDQPSQERKSWLILTWTLQSWDLSAFRWLKFHRQILYQINLHVEMEKQVRLSFLPHNSS